MACNCTTASPCAAFAPVLSRCLLDFDQYPAGIDHALCMTESTLDDVLPASLLVDNFTIAFWARAREPLAFNQTPTASGVVPVPRGSLFAPLTPYSNNLSISVINFYLGTDGFSVQQNGNGLAASIVVERRNLFNWHHYSIVFDRREPYVYIDGNSNHSSQNRVSSLASVVLFRAAFGRHRTTFPLSSYGTGFEGWISELRLANQTMHGGEALAKMSNVSAWNANFSMRGCSGENHAGTAIDVYKLQQAFLVCAKPIILDALLFRGNDDTVWLRIDGNGFGIAQFTTNTSIFIRIETNEFVCDEALSRTSNLLQCRNISMSVIPSKQTKSQLQVISNGVASNPFSIVGVIFQRCLTIEDDAPVDSAFCYSPTTNTNLSSLELMRYRVQGAFTVAFWAKPFTPVTISVPGLSKLFGTDWPFGLSVYLGIDEILVSHRNESNLCCFGHTLTLRNLTQWHHYVINYNRTAVVLLVNGDIAATRIIDGPGGSLNFVPAFVSFDYAYKSFQGLVADLRISNESMTPAEAYLATLPNSTFEWTHRFKMNACSGNNLVADPEPLWKAVRNGYFVCKEPLPMCGINSTDVEPWGSAGCSCLQLDGSRSCLAGFMSPDNVVFGTRPLAYWRLDHVDENGTVIDLSGNKLHGQLIGRRMIDYDVDASGISFKTNRSFIDFGNNTLFNFGTRNFAIEFRVSVNTSQFLDVVFLKRFIGPCGHASFYKVYINVNGRVVFEVDEAGGEPYIVLNSCTTIRDGQIHNVLVVRRARVAEIFVDGLLCGSSTGAYVANLNNSDAACTACQSCTSGGGGERSRFFSGRLSELAVYVDVVSPPHRLCDDVGHWTPTNKTVCGRVDGFCSPNKQPDRQCCLATNCVDCAFDYRNCSRMLDLLPTTTSLTTTSASSTNFLTTTVAAATPATMSTPDTLSESIATTTVTAATMLSESTLSVNSMGDQTITTSLPSNAFDRSIASPVGLSISIIAGIVAGIVAVVAVWCIISRQSRLRAESEHREHADDRNGSAMKSGLSLHILC